MPTPNQLREEFKKFNGDQIGDDIIADYWLAKLEEARKEAVEGERERTVKSIKSWVYQYDNYRTMMNSKKAFEVGSLARDLAKELSYWLYPHSKDEKLSDK